MNWIDRLLNHPLLRWPLMWQVRLWQRFFREREESGMSEHCERCGRWYDDEFQWTLCPHNPLEAGPKPEDYCRRHDFLGPCPICNRKEKEDEQRVSGPHAERQG